MALFPTLIRGPKKEFTVTSKWNTIISDTESGKENRTQTWSFPKRTIVLPMMDVLDDDANAIMNFFNNTALGAKNSFRYVWSQARDRNKEYVGLGNAIIVTFNLPCKESTIGGVTAYVSGVETSGTFSSGTGSDGLDQFIFNPAPALGAVIQADIDGKWTPLVRFPDEMDETWLFYNLFEYKEIRLLEVRD